MIKLKSIYTIGIVFFFLGCAKQNVNLKNSNPFKNVKYDIPKLKDSKLKGKVKSMREYIYDHNEKEGELEKTRVNGSITFDGSGAKWNYLEFDRNGKVLTTFRFDEKDSLKMKNIFHYNGKGNLTKRLNFNVKTKKTNIINAYSYDIPNRVMKVTRPNKLGRFTVGEKRIYFNEKGKINKETVSLFVEDSLFQSEIKTNKYNDKGELIEVEERIKRRGYEFHSKTKMYYGKSGNKMKIEYENNTNKAIDRIEYAYNSESQLINEKKYFSSPDERETVETTFEYVLDTILVKKNQKVIFKNGDAIQEDYEFNEFGDLIDYKKINSKKKNRRNPLIDFEASISYEYDQFGNWIRQVVVSDIQESRAHRKYRYKWELVREISYYK